MTYLEPEIWRYKCPRCGLRGDESKWPIEEAKTWLGCVSCGMVWQELTRMPEENYDEY